MTHADDIDAIQIGPDPDKLLVYHRQQLSAMLDGELSPDQAKFMLRRLQHDAELAACWDRWQVCGDMLRGQHHALLPSGFAARVAAGIAGDGHAQQETAAAARPMRRLRWGGGAALAASVALVAVFAPRMLPDGGEAAPVPEASPVVGAQTLPGAGDTAATPAVADTASRDEAPALPAPADAAPLVLATALAAADTPRRNAERRARAQEQRVASAPQQVQVGSPADDARSLAVAVTELPAALDLAGPHAAFPAPAILQPRPWPRAILPGAVDPAFNVGYGQVPSSLQAGDDAYDPFFRPRIAVPVILAPPADAEPVEPEPVPTGGGVATQ